MDTILVVNAGSSSVKFQVFAAAQTLPEVATATNFWQWNVGLKPGTNATAYMQALNDGMGSGGRGQSPFEAFEVRVRHIAGR